MKTIFRYLFRDPVDLILLLATITLAIRQSTENMLITAILSVFALYIIGTIFRMGKATDNLDNYVYDKYIRLQLHLSAIPCDTYKPKKTILAKAGDILFWLVLALILTFVIIRL
jgi:hypothetical protein